MQNPFYDAFQFVIGATSDHQALGAWRYLLVILFIVLIAASVYLAWRNWQEDAEQRSGRHLGTWFVRVMIGCMWFQGMIWKLPLPASGGLQYWTEQMAQRAAFDVHRTFVTDVVIPNLHLLGPFVFLAELTFAVALILGLGVRLASVLAIAFVLNLWLGIYIPGEPAEWPWSYVFLMFLMLQFALYAAGRSLGLDAWLRRNIPAVRNGTGLIGRFLRIAG